MTSSWKASFFGKVMFIALTVLILYMQGLHNSGDFYTKEQHDRLPNSSNAWKIFNPTGLRLLASERCQEHPEGLDGEGLFNSMCSPL